MLKAELDGGVLRIRLSGSWTLSGPPQSTTDLMEQVSSAAITRIAVDAQGLSDWDTRLVALMDQVQGVANGRGIQTDWSSLPPGVQRLLDLSLAVPERVTATHVAEDPLITRLGKRAHARLKGVDGWLIFVGEVLTGMLAFVRGRARFRRQDFATVLQQTGADALGVVALVNLLIGMILAFVGASQLQNYGASIYVADLVAIAMVRDMAAIMTAVVMAGRSGAAFAAALGTMNTNQEIDALRTLGISPIEFLVVPRVLAITVMLPLLTLYACGIGLIGGALVAGGMLGTSPELYAQNTWNALTAGFLLGGLLKATTYGLLVGLAGTYYGLRSGRSAEGVGLATTQAVVVGIVLIIAAAGGYAVIFYAMGW